jgi:hypothetical protein
LSWTSWRWRAEAAGVLNFSEFNIGQPSCPPPAGLGKLTVQTLVASVSCRPRAVRADEDCEIGILVLVLMVGIIVFTGALGVDKQFNLVSP